MKFLMTIWIIRFLFSMLDNAESKKIIETKKDIDAKHPAEFELR
jgi:hypothetical protein